MIRLKTFRLNQKLFEMLHFRVFRTKKPFMDQRHWKIGLSFVIFQSRERANYLRLL